MRKRNHTNGSPLNWAKKLFGGAAFAFGALSVSAAPLYFDANGTTAGAGPTNANWSASVWSTDSTGVAAPGAWTANSKPVFSAGSDGTGTFFVTNNVAAASRRIDGATVEEGNVIITNNIITNVSGGVFDIALGSQLTISSTLNVSVNSAKQGAGKLFLGTANTGTGKWSITAGEVILTGSTGLGAAPGAFTADATTINGGTVTLSNTATLTWEATRGITLGASGGTIKSDSSNGSSTLAATSMKIAGTTLIKDGPNEFRLQNSATTMDFAKLVVKNGRWVAGSGTSLGSDRSFGGALGSYVADAITLDGSTGRIDFNGGTVGSLITLDVNRGITITSNGGGVECEGSSGRIPSKITGPGTLYRYGPQMLYLSGDNDFAGGIRFATAIAGSGRVSAAAGTGIVAIEHNNALGTGTIRFDANGSLVANVAGLTVPNSHFWNSTSQTYGRTERELFLVSAPTLGTNLLNSQDITFTGDVNTGSSGSAPSVVIPTNVMTFAGAITNTLGFTKSGAGTMIISGNNTYGNAATAAGQTTVSGGTLLVDNLTGSGAGVSDVTVNSGATLGGIGSISGALTNKGAIAAGTLSAKVGTLTSGSQTWITNASVNVELNDASTAEGVGHDYININGALVIDATNINFVVSTLNGQAAGSMANFSSSNPGGYAWKIVSASGGITGFNPAAVTINVAGFANATDGGVFSVSQIGNDLYLLFRNAAHVVTNPSNQTSSPTGTASFSVVAVGETPISYTWKKDGSNLSNGTMANGTVVAGADTATLSLSNISPSDIASGSLFNVGVTNTAGGAESATASLTLVDPAISTEPSSLTVGAGTNAVFTVFAQGSPTLTYVWSKDGLPIDTGDTHYTGANTATLTVIGATDADEGGYDVLVSNGNGSAQSATASLTVINPPVITTEPAAQSKTAGQNATFSVVATGDNLKYQWRKDGSNISGKTTSSLTLNNVQIADIADYSVVITNLAGTAISANAHLTVQLTLTANSGSVFGFVAKSPDKALYDANESVTLTASSSNPNIVFSGWSGSVTSTNNPLTITMDANKTLTANYISTVPDVIVDDNATVNATNSPGSKAIFTGSWTRDASSTPPFTGIGYSVGTPVTNSPPTATVKYVPNITTAGNYDIYARWTPGGNRTPDAPYTVVSASATVTNRLNQQNAAGTNFVLVASAKYFQVGTNGHVILGNDCSNTAMIADSIKFVYSVSQQDTPASIVSGPTNLTVGPGTNAQFTVSATGTAPLFYQWKKNGNNLVDGGKIAGAQTSALTITGALSADAGTYSVVVTNVGGPVTANATLTLDPGVTAPPVSITNNAGTTATFSVTATGTGTLTYLWKKNGSNLPAETGSTLTLNNVLNADEGNYSVLVTGDNGAEETPAASLTVIDPVIISNPTGVVVGPGTNATLTVSAAGTSLSYQWKKGGVNVSESNASGATSSTLTITGATAANDGSYTVDVTGADGTVTSTAASIVVRAAPTIVTPPADTTVNYSSNVTLTVLATGDNLSYAWYKNGTNLLTNSVTISGATTPSLTISNVSGADAAAYTVHVGNEAAVVNATANLTVVDPYIVASPTNTAVGVSGTLTLNVDAIGTSLGYQWSKNGSPLSGETSATYTKTGVALGDAGSYSVVVTGTYGSVTSAVAVVSVDTPIIVKTPPKAASKIAGQTNMFTVIVMGPNPTYQWQLNQVDIPGATQSSYTVDPVSVATGGNYRVVVSNAAGSVNSPEVALTVLTDVALPSIKATVPLKNFGYSDSSSPAVSGYQLAISGTAADAARVTNVTYSINGSAEANAPITGAINARNWTATVPVVPGTNVVTLKAYDFSGNVSPALVIPFFYNVPSTFTLNVNGVGSVLSKAVAWGNPINGASLLVGRPYTLTAVPDPTFGNIFTNWTDGGNAVLQTNVLIYNFIMSSNLTINANFITNPFSIYAGTYNGLFFETNGIAHRSAGFIFAKVTSKQAVSAKLSFDGNTFAASGKFRIDGSTDLVVKRDKIGKSNLNLHLQMDFGGGSDKVLGTLTETNVNWVANIEADRLVWTPTNHATTNMYTVVLPGFTNASEGPMGDSFMVYNVATNGDAKVLVNGLSDYAKPAKFFKTAVSKNGSIAVFSQLYQQAYANPIDNTKIVKEYMGELIGWLTIQTNTNTVSMNLAPLGALQWNNPGVTNVPAYANGFTNAAEVKASLYQPQLPGTRVMNVSTAAVTIAEGELAGPITATVAWDINNKWITQLPLDSTLFKPTFTATKAAIGGAFKHPANTAVATKVFGVVLQDYNTGTGYFVSPNGVSGTVNMTPTATP